MLLVSGATRDVAKHAGHPNLGVLLRPGNGNRPPTDMPWAIDNGAFAGFDADAFVGLLNRCKDAPGCLWVACPDVVGDSAATDLLYYEWAPRIQALGFPTAWVAQDGATPNDIPFGCVAVFIGGSTEWKLGPSARSIVEVAKELGLMAHMGRVNTMVRMRIASDWGCDSVDGTQWSRFARTYLALGLSRLDALDRQRRLFQ